MVDLIEQFTKQHKAAAEFLGIPKMLDQMRHAQGLIAAPLRIHDEMHAAQERLLGPARMLHDAIAGPLRAAEEMRKSQERLFGGMHAAAEQILGIKRMTTGASRVMEEIARNQRTFDNLYREASWLRAPKSFEHPRDYFREQQELVGAAEKRWVADSATVRATMPKRGWYLYGKVPCTLISRLAKLIRQADWDKVDASILKHLPKFRLEAFRSWLEGKSVPPYCVDRLFLFLQHHDAGNFEESTALGIPLLDEIAKFLFEGKAFTTKRGRARRGEQARPEIGYKTQSGPQIKEYYEPYVQSVGCLQEDADPKRFADEDYWNRHAIVHGLMRRKMGIKDSAKCVMAIAFLTDAVQERDETAEDAAPEGESEAGDDLDVGLEAEFAT